jgi:quaternary ammonium compound-resistance protein SugE
VSPISAGGAWACLLLSGLADVAWAISLKKADGFSHLGWSAVSLVLLGVFVLLLGKALDVLPLGLAYAVWTGVGAAGSVIVGWALFHEPMSGIRIAMLSLIVGGVVGLRLSS